jgi:hypothetical protein
LPIDSFETRGIPASRNSRRPIGTSISNDKSSVAFACIVQIAHAFQRTCDPHFLIMGRDQYEEPGLPVPGIGHGRTVEKRTHREEPLIQNQQREREQYQKKKYPDNGSHEI